MRPRGEFRVERSLQTVSSVGGSSQVLADVCPGSAPHVSTAGLAAPHTAGSISTAHPALPRAGVTDQPGATEAQPAMPWNC